MIEQEQPSAGSEDPTRLGHRLAVVRDAEERARADDGIERRVRKRERLSITLTEISLAPQLPCSSPRDGQHLWTRLDAGRANPVRIEGEVATRDDGDLEHVP